MKAADHHGSPDAATGAADKTGSAVSKLAQAGRATHRHLGRTAGQMVGGGDRDWARTVLADVEKPDEPVSRPWRVSIATLIGQHPKVPGIAAKPLGLLDRFGEVTITPDEVGFDGKNVAWDKVLEVRTHSIAGVLPDVAVEKEVDRIRELLPPIPGRKWVVTKAAEGLLTLLLATTDMPGAHTDSTGPDDTVIACEIVFKNLIGRPKQLAAGLFGTAILGAIPEATASLIATAQARSVPVHPVASDAIGSRAERAQRLRAVSTKLARQTAGMTARRAGGSDDRGGPAGVPGPAEGERQ